MWLARNRYKCSGIEPPGCYNTGHAPSVAHQYYSGLHTKEMYIVGCELDVRNSDVRIRAYNKLQSGGYVVPGKDTLTGCKVYVYATMAPARKRYKSLCQEARKSHAEERARIHALHTQAENGDLSAVLSLGLDY